MNNLEIFFLGKMQSRIQHYNHKKYWNYRKIVIDKSNKTSKVLKIYYLYKIKKMDAYNNASLGTHLNYGAIFETVPNLPHGIRGIFISHNAKIGKNCEIFQHVVIGQGKGGAPIIGNNVIIGAGAKLIGNIRIGNNVKIGAGCIVVEDIPDNATVVMPKARIIERNSK